MHGRYASKYELSNALRFVAVVIFVQSSGISNAASQAIVDQEFVIDPVLPALAIDERQDVAQTFTVGITGTLTRVDLQIFRGDPQSASPLVLEMRRTLVDGLPDESDAGLLAVLPITAVLPRLIIAPPNLVQVELGPQSVPVDTGDILSISLHSMAAPNEWYLWASGAPAYNRGSGFFRSEFTGGAYRYAGTDLGFRTFVVPIPEPSSFVCAVVSAAALFGTLRPSKRKHLPPAHSE